MSFHAEKCSRKNGTEFIRIRYWVGESHKTLPQTDHPEFKDIEEAREFCRVQNAKKDADRHLEKHAKGKDALKWKKHYQDLSKEVDLFIDWYKAEAPNSWESVQNWLHHYTLPYFLGVGLNNPNLWYTKFEDFRKWLEKDAKTKAGGELSYSSKNHIIKALNKYITYLGLHSKMDMVTAQVKCRYFDASLTVRRGADDLFQPDEVAILNLTLTVAREYFLVLINTGMRYQELYSLQFSNVCQGSDDLDESLVEPFRQMGKTIYGYIRLESQNKKKFGFRDLTNGTIARKPLKSKPKISAQYNRIIPITDKECWDILVANRRRAFKEWEDRSYISKNPDDYLLFNVDSNAIRRDFRLHTMKSPHCCRHTFTTNLVRSFRTVNYGTELIKGITGHTSAEFDRYVHIALEDETASKKKKVSNF